jgi:hypothetical protein
MSIDQITVRYTVRLRSLALHSRDLPISSAFLPCHPELTGFVCRRLHDRSRGHTFHADQLYTYRGMGVRGIGLGCVDMWTYGGYQGDCWRASWLVQNI